MVLKLVNCNKCDKKCNSAYELRLDPSVQSNKFICRDCALKIMKEHYDKRPDEIETTD